MKKTLLLLLATIAMMASMTAKAQRVTLSTGPENKKFDTKCAANALIIDEDPATLLMVTREHKGFLQGGSDEDLVLRRVDKGLNLLQEAKIVNSKDCELFGFGLTDTTAAILMCDQSKKVTQISRTIIDRRTFDILASEVVTNNDHSRKDKDYLWHITSENGQYTAVVTLSVLHTGEYTCEVLMFDHVMNLLWKRSHPLKGVSDMHLTNSGELYVMVSNRVNMATTIYIDRFTSEAVESAEVQIPDGLNSCVIANIVGSRILMGGTLRYAEAKRDGSECNGVYALSYDMAARQIVKFSTAELHHDDVAVINDKKQSAKIRKIVVDDLFPDQTCATKFGGAFSFTRPFAIKKTSSNGAESTYYSRIGKVVVAADMNGNFLYKVPIRHFQLQADASDLLTTPLISDGYNVYLFQTEHPATDPEYNIAKKTQCVTVLDDKVNTAMYSINLEGGVTKTVTSTKQKNVLLGSSHTWNNDKYFLLHIGGKECHVMQVQKESLTQ